MTIEVVTCNTLVPSFIDQLRALQEVQGDRFLRTLEFLLRNSNDENLIQNICGFLASHVNDRIQHIFIVDKTPINGIPTTEGNIISEKNDIVIVIQDNVGSVYQQGDNWVYNKKGDLGSKSINFIGSYTKYSDLPIKDKAGNDLTVPQFAYLSIKDGNYNPGLYSYYLNPKTNKNEWFEIGKDYSLTKDSDLTIHDLTINSLESDGGNIETDGDGNIDAKKLTITKLTINKEDTNGNVVRKATLETTGAGYLRCNNYFRVDDLILYTTNQEDVNDKDRIRLGAEATNTAHEYSPMMSIFRGGFHIGGVGAAGLYGHDTTNFLGDNVAPTDRFIYGSRAWRVNPMPFDKVSVAGLGDKLRGTIALVMDWYSINDNFLTPVIWEKDNATKADCRPLTYPFVPANVASSLPKDRPVGTQSYDTATKKPVWWNGQNWADAAGNVVA